MMKEELRQELNPRRDKHTSWGTRAEELTRAGKWLFFSENCERHYMPVHPAPLFHLILQRSDNQKAELPSLRQSLPFTGPRTFWHCFWSYNTQLLKILETICFYLLVWRGLGNDVRVFIACCVKGVPFVCFFYKYHSFHMINTPFPRIS